MNLPGRDRNLPGYGSRKGPAALHKHGGGLFYAYSL